MKNFIQSVKSTAIFLAFALFLSVPLSLHAVAPELSPEDLKMLDEIGKEVEKYVNALPTEAQLRSQGVPEEEIKKRETKEKFDAEVKRYSEMSEKQLLEEMEKVFAEANQAPQPQPEVEKPIYTPPQPEIAKPIEKPIIPSDKQLAALKLIDGVLISINNFMNKAQIMVELPGKIPTWVKEGKLRNWPAGLSWNTFSNQIEELQAKLNKIKDRDPRSGFFKYLDDFIKDESLNNNLAKVRDSLMRNEPKIDLSSFGLDKMSTESRAAVRSVLLSLHEAISILAIPTALDKIIEKYEPTAKKIKESEESAQKRAVEESRRTRYTGPSITSTAPARERERLYGRGHEFERFNPSTLEAPTKGEKSSEELSKGKKGEVEGGKGEGAKKAEAATKEEKVKRETDKKAEQYEGEFLAGLEAFTDAVHENSHLTDIETHVKSAEPVDEEIMNLIKAGTDGIKKASNAVRKMKLQLSKLNENQKKEYKKALKDGYKNARKDIDSIYTQINNISKKGQVSGLLPLGNPKHIENIKAKYYAYFGKEDQTDIEKQRTALETQLEKKKESLEKLKDELESKKQTISKARQNANLTSPPSPLPLHIVKMENEVIKIKTQVKSDESDIKKLNTEVKKLEDLMTQTNKANLSDLKDKIQQLRKAVDEI